MSREQRQGSVQRGGGEVGRRVKLLKTKSTIKLRMEIDQVDRER